MKNSKVSMPGLFWLLAALLSLMVSLQTQAMCVFCKIGGIDKSGRYTWIDDPEENFNAVDVVVTVRYIGQDKLDLPRYKISSSWKSGLKPGTIITVLTTPHCECCTNLPKEGIAIAYLYRFEGTTRRGISGSFFYADRCAKHIHESEAGYAERIRWLNAHVKQSSR